MRTAWLLPVLAVALACVPASAQLPAAQFTVEAKGPDGPVAPRETATLAFTVARVCPNAVAVLDPQVVEAAVHGPPEALVAGPGQVLFDQQACAVERVQSRAVQYGVTPSREAEGMLLGFLARFTPHATSPLAPGGGEARATFSLAVTQEVLPTTESRAGDGGRLTPGPGLLLSLAGLGVAAAALARRRGA